MSTTMQKLIGHEAGQQEPLNVRASQAAKAIAPFMGTSQLRAIAAGCRGEEGKFFMEKLIEIAALIEGMPKSYEQDGKGDSAIVTLHYFLGGSDWYITEKDIEGGVDQAFGYAVLNGDEECAELGYISIRELTRCGVELDLHFTPRTLREVKAERAGASAAEQAEPFNPNPWVIVTNPGQDDEDIWADFCNYMAAISGLKEAPEGAQIMRRLDDGTLTTEF